MPASLSVDGPGRALRAEASAPRSNWRDSSRTLVSAPGSTPAAWPRSISRRVRMSGSRVRSRSRSDSSAASCAAVASCGVPRARSSRCASRGCSPISAMARPVAVMTPWPSMASSFASRSRACDSAAAGGTSIHCRRVASRAPQRASSSASGARSELRISGGVCAASVTCAPSPHSRHALPGAVRPARPARCAAEACEMRAVTRRCMPVPGSNIERRASPESTTTRTPSMVSEVSAMFVDRITLRRPLAAGRSTCCWAARSSSPYSAHSSKPRAVRSCSASRRRWISGEPGRNTSTSPTVSPTTRRTCCASGAISRGPSVRDSGSCGRPRPR